MRRLCLALTTTLVLPLLVGCGASRRARQLEGNFSIEQPGEGWGRVLTGGADRAWFNEELSATLYADSNCAARFEDGELSDLLVHLTSGIARGSEIERQDLMLDSRAALVKVFDGSLDGVSVRLATMVTKKDECLYDIVYMAPPSRFAEGRGAFDAVVASFATSGR